MFEEIVQQSSSKYSELSLINEEDFGDYVELTIHGGLNGYGEWRDYFSDLIDLIDNLDVPVWVIDFFVDSVDDVFTIKLGVIPKND